MNQYKTVTLLENINGRLAQLNASMELSQIAQKTAGMSTRSTSQEVSRNAKKITYLVPSEIDFELSLTQRLKRGILALSFREPNMCRNMKVESYTILFLIADEHLKRRALFYKLQTSVDQQKSVELVNICTDIMLKNFLTAALLKWRAKKLFI